MNGWWKDILAALVAGTIILLLACNAFGDMVEVGPVRQVRGEGVLRELAARLSAGDIRPYPGRPDVVSTAHGLAHDLNSAVRNRHGGTDKVNAAYMPGGVALLLPEPSNLTLSEVRNNTAKRGRVRMPISDWNNQPLYLIDELSAYCCGAVSGIENGSRERANQSIGFASDVYQHCLVMARLARQRGYPHADELDAFLRMAGEYIEQLTFQTLDPGTKQ